MKKGVFILSFLILMITVNFVFAQTSTKRLSYQAVVRNAANELVVNQNLSVEVTILDAEQHPQYKETHASVPTNQNGLLWLWVGAGTPTLGTMEEVVWKDAVIRSVFTLPDGNTVTQNTPVTAMPYAYYADEVDTFFLQDYLTTHDYGNEDYVTHEELDDTLGHYVLDTDFSDFTDEVGQNFTKMTNRMDTLLTHVCDSVKECVTGWISDSTRMVVDSLGAYYDTTKVKKAIHDTAVVLRGMMVDAANNGQITIKKNNVEVDHFTVNQADDQAINITVPTTVAELTDAANYVTNAKLGDTLGAYYDTAYVNQTLKQYLKTGALCDSIVKCDVVKDMRDSIQNAFDTLAIFFDSTKVKSAIRDTANALRGEFPSVNNGQITIAVNRGTVDNPSFNVNQGGTQTVTINIPEEATVNNGQLTIVAAGDTTRFKANQASNDTVRLNKFATKDTLDNFVNKLAIRDSVNNIVKDSLAASNSATNHAIDTIARHNISDSTRMVFDTLHLYYTTLQTLKDTASNIRSAFPTVNNGTLTIQKNGTSVGSFTANQATPENINIDVPTKLSQMINDGGVYAKRDSINVFTAENNFTSTVTVPSNTTTIPRPTTAEHPCTDNTANAVNICDLLAVFDSLNNRIKKLEDNMALMKSTMKPTTITSSIVNSATTTNAITVQATATNSAFNILSYEFCCSDCGDGVTPVCTTITSNSYTFENLNSYTDYHFTVKAHTFIDTVESSPVQAKTKAEAPTATYVVTALPVPQAGFTVDLSEIDLKGVENGTVKVAYKKSTASNYGNESTENINASSDTYSKTVSNLEGNTSYDVRIKIDNGDAVTTYNSTVTTGDAVTFAITRIFPENSSVKRCSGNKVSAFFSIAPNIGEVSDYDYQWSTTGSGTSQSQVDSLYLVEYTTTGTKTVSCTATYKLNTDISFQRSVTLSIVKNSNTNVYSGDEPYYDVNIDGHTVTLTDIGGSDMFVDWVSWENNAFPVVAGNPPAHTYDEYGTYSISAYSSDGCKTTTTNVKVDPSVNVTNDHEPDNIGLCGESEVQVTYTAVPEEGEINDYSYSWSVSSGATIVSQTNNTCVVNYTSAGDYTITCNATHTASNTPIQKITNTTINSGSKPTLVLCQEDNSLQLLSFGDATYIDWGYDFPNQSSTPYTNEVTPNYPQGSYTVTIRNNAGCSSSKEVYFGVVHSFVPCVLSEIDPSGTHPAQETAATGVDANHNNDGLESVENGAITSITDYDGNVYSVVQIGSQCWLAENMRCTHSPSTGTLIVNPQGLSGNNAKGSCSFKTAHWYNNNPSQYGAYGLYYDWCAAVDTYYVAGGYNETDWGENTSFHSKAWSCVFTETHRRGICPKGWHIPTDDEWNVMEAEVDGASATYTNTGYRGSHAGKLARDWCRWKSSDVTNAPGNKSANRNSSYFGAMNAGRYTNSAFVGSDDWISNAYFWSASSYNNDNAWSRRLTYNYPGVYRESGGREKTNGLSVRCLRDYEVGSSNFTPSATTDEASNLGPHTATLNGSIANANIYTISSKGFEYKASTASDYTQVLAGGNEFTYNLIGLAANTTYQYRAFAVYAGGTVYGEEVSFTTPEPVTVLSITPDISSPVSICKNGSTLGSKAVTYTAAVTYDEAPVNGYRYSWSVPSGLQYNTNGNTCTVVYKATGTTYAVTCTATPDNNVGDPFVETSQTVLTTTDVSSLPSFTSCENDYGRSVEIKTSTNVDSYTWGGNTLSSSNSGCTYANDGVYVITANDNSNCTTTKMVAIGLATTSPCTVTSHHTNDAEYTPTTGGLETENNEGKVLTVQDQDGHSYAVVQIGNQCWMRSNLRTTTYSDGTTIPNGTPASGANTLSATDPYRYKPVSSSSFMNYEFQNYNEVTDGLYYNWVAAMHGAASSTANPSGVQGVCPKGWHLPSDAEWQQMYNWVYNNHPVTNPGNQIAFFVCGGCQWNSALSTITYKPGDFDKPDRNYSGFTALPVGYVGDNGKFKFYHITDNLNNNPNLQYSWFWSSCEKSGDTSEADNWWLSAGVNLFQKDDEKKLCGASVRCVRDAE